MRVSGVALLALLFSGCATTPRWDGRFGETVRATLATQVANPAAAANANPVSGIDGRAARATQERYEHSFKDPSIEASAASPMLGK
jgi:type IV pilus biogenesis protein CpaD/CtpE